jgi:hypothetical protein
VAALVGVALPLYVVTMASQNVPGVAVIRASGYQVPISPLIGWTGAANLLLAPFGGFALNLAAITAAICMGREAHEDPEALRRRHRRRYLLSVDRHLRGHRRRAFPGLPEGTGLTIAGFALLGTIGSALATAAGPGKRTRAGAADLPGHRLGISLAGIGSAFWGLLAGLAALLVLRARPRTAQRRRRTAGRCRLALERFPALEQLQQLIVDFAQARRQPLRFLRLRLVQRRIGQALADRLLLRLEGRDALRQFGQFARSFHDSLPPAVAFCRPALPARPGAVTTLAAPAGGASSAPSRLIVGPVLIAAGVLAPARRRLRPRSSGSPRCR